MDQTRFYLESLFADAVAEGLGFSLFALPSKDSWFFRDIETALAWIGQRRETQNLYARIGLLKNAPENRGTASDTVGIPGLWAEIDLHKPEAKKPYPKTETEALAAIAEAGPAPSLTVHTGGGLQFYWLFREPWLFDSDADRDRAAGLLRRWELTIRACLEKRGYTCDSVHDLARVLRIPGTLNLKGPEPRPVEARWN